MHGLYRQVSYEGHDHDDNRYIVGLGFLSKNHVGPSSIVTRIKPTFPSHAVPVMPFMP